MADESFEMGEIAADKENYDAAIEVCFTRFIVCLNGISICFNPSVLLK